MTDTAQLKQETSNLETLFPAKVRETQERNAEILTSANEILLTTAQAIGKAQMEFLQREVEQASQAFTPVKSDKDAGAAVSNFGTQWHDNTLNLIKHMRTINDLTFDCGWQLFQLGANNFRRLPKHS